MNILAHGYLSDRNDGFLTGNFIGDFIKGDPASPRHKLRTEEVAGVRLHRAIDSFTDAHPAVAAVRELLHPRCHKYAGVAVDVFFDHFLARQFEPLTGETLDDFTAFFYAALRQLSLRFPASAVRMLDGMIRYDWISNYQTFDGIDRSLNGIARRTAFPSGLDTAIIDLERYYGQINSQFLQFWPELVEHASQVRKALLFG
ncbi:ACP phosphodiesterase [Spirosoma sp. SC4-14]|uniref:acyl carrier protein phosphodiesterase n=1 Tax=Spirosoma sp. SC4-14 TaxID=3128900 RepID=UPI0030D41BDA